VILVKLIAEKTAKNFRGLLYFSAPGIASLSTALIQLHIVINIENLHSQCNDVTK